MQGQVFHELEVNAPANNVWELYGSPTFANFIQEQLKDIFVKIEHLHGDGDVGTLRRLVFVPGALPGSITTFIERVTKVDKEKRIKEKEAVEGGYLDLGFTFYRYRFEILEKDKDSCIIKSTIEYHLKQEAAANAYTVSLAPGVKIAEAAKFYIMKNKSSN